MATLNLRVSFDCPLDGVIVRGGRSFEPYTFTVTKKIDQSHTIATTATAQLLNLGSAATDDLADADFIWIESDQDLLIEIKGTTAADNSNIKILASKPIYFTTDDTLAYAAAGGFAGAAQVITQIKAKNPGATTANIRVVAFT